MANIKTVARAAGVSVSTVSNALNGKKNVGAKTRALVFKTAESLNYMPSVVASGNITKQTNIIGLFFDIGSLAYDSISNELLEGSILEAANFGKRILPYYGIKNSRELLSILRPGCQPIDSAILLSPKFIDLRMDRLAAESIPFLVIGNPGYEHPGTPFIDIDNEKACYQMTSNLIELGHRNIAMINFKLGYHLTEDRFKGYLQALKDNSIEFNPNLNFNCDTTEDDGYHSITKLIRKKIPFSAVIVSMPIIAKGVYSALKYNGLAVGRDVSVVSFVKDTFDLDPKLSYGKFDFKMIGREAVLGLISLAENKDLVIAKTIDIDLCYYDSCQRKL